MTHYPYGRIQKLADSLHAHNIAPDVIAQIMAGGEEIRQSTRPILKAAWLKEAMQRMNKLLDKETRFAVREACACCLGGKRGQLSREIAQKYATFEERLQAANQTRFVFGHSVTLQEDGRILVSFQPAGWEHYRCSCLPQANEPLPVLYCQCCGGHVKHHLQNALDLKLSVVVRSSALSSGGKRPCTFLLTLQSTA